MVENCANLSAIFLGAMLSYFQSFALVILCATCMLCSNPPLLHTVTINGVFFTKTRNHYTKIRLTWKLRPRSRVYLASERWCDSFQLSSGFVSVSFTMVDATIKIGYMLSNTVLYILLQSWSAKISGKDFPSERELVGLNGIFQSVSQSSIVFCICYLISARELWKSWLL